VTSFTFGKLISRKRHSLEWFQDQVFNVRDFAAMCFGLPLPLRCITLTSDGAAKSSGRDRREVKLYFRDQRNSIGERRSSEFPLLPLHAISQENNDSLSSWIDCKDSFQQTIDLIFVLLYTQFLHVEIRFLLMMQAFEAFDRAAFPRKLVDDETFKRVYEAILAAVPQGLPPEVRQKMDSAVKFANEPSLRQRLRNFYKIMSIDLGAEPMGFNSKNINRIVNTRNFYTHYPENFTEEKLSFAEMHENSERFCILLILAILNRMGFNLKTLKNRTSYHSTFRKFVMNR
jgi:hypothetical protein